MTHDNLNATLSPVQRKQVHQLPPIIQVTMVAIDEESAVRLQSYSTLPPDWSANMFKICTTQTALTRNSWESHDTGSQFVLRQVEQHR